MATTVLAIGAHYDDCVFGVSGTLLKLIRKNYRVVILSIIGDYSRWRPVEGRAEELLEKSRDLAHYYGVEMRFLHYASMRFDFDAEAKRAVSEVVAEVSPDVAFMLWPDDTHPDHEAASRLSKTALAWAGTVLDRDGVGRPRRIYQYDNGPRHTISFEPDVSVDISDDWVQANEWLGLLMAFVRNQPDSAEKQDPAQAAKEALALYRGKACGVAYAEAFKSFQPYPSEIL